MEFPALDRLERLTRDIEDLQQKMEKRVEEIRTESAETVGHSGLVWATVDHSGRVAKIRLDPRAMRMASQELAEEIAATVGRAQDEASTRLREAVRDVLGTDIPLDGLPVAE